MYVLWLGMILPPVINCDKPQYQSCLLDPQIKHLIKLQNGGRKKVNFIYSGCLIYIVCLVRTQIVGVVGDIRRDMEGHHYAEKCSVFGINATELAALQRLVHYQAKQIHPFTPKSN